MMIALLVCLGLFEDIAAQAESNRRELTAMRRHPVAEMICADQYYSVNATHPAIDARDVVKVASKHGPLDRFCIIHLSYSKAETEAVAFRVNSGPGAHRIWLTCSEDEWEDMLVLQLDQLKRQPQATERMPYE